MKLCAKELPAVGALLALAACATIRPPLPPSLELPKPPTDLRAARKGDKVTLTWTIPTATTDRETVRSLGRTRICRSQEPTLTECGVPLGEAAPPAVITQSAKQKSAMSYTDALPQQLQLDRPLGFVTYAVGVPNASGRSAGLSNQVKVSSVPTLAPFPNFAAQVTAQGVKISWSYPPPPGRVPDYRCVFRIYRRVEGGTALNKITDINLGHCLGLTSLIPLNEKLSTQAPNPAASNSVDQTPPDNNFLDQSFEWEKTYYYRGTVVSIVAEAGKPDVEVEGDDTPEVKVFADDVFPPAVPSGLQAVFSGPGQQPFIDLVWAPVPDIDLAGYYIYRREEGTAPVRLNTDPLKAPAYRDANVAGGKRYFYSVSAIDLRGNESARSEEASEAVP